MRGDPRNLVEELKSYRAAYCNATDVAVPTEILDDAIEVLGGLYALGLVAEEMGEAIQLVGKALRFGLDTPGRTAETARDMLPAELGDVEAAIHFAALDGIVRFPDLIGARERKKARLLDPASVDSMDRRLAPEPRGSRRQCPHGEPLNRCEDCVREHQEATR